MTNEKTVYCEEKLIQKYTRENPLIATVVEKESAEKGKFECREDGVYSLCEPNGVNEATIVCGGQILYDTAQAQQAELGGDFDFRPSFKLARSCFAEADLAIANFSSMAASIYPGSELFDNKYSKNPHFTNARPSYLKALRYAGFDCMAMASPYNAQTSAAGILSTEKALAAEHLLCSGIGTAKNPIINLNQVNTAVLSYTMECYDGERYLTEEGISDLLNLYRPETIEQDIVRMREKGADFVLVYLNCDCETPKTLEERISAAEQIAEAGADYVICTAREGITPYSIYRTKDDRTVPIASCLGIFMSGSITESTNLTALIQITLYKSADGKIEISDRFIPLKRFEEYQKYPFPTVPAINYFYRHKKKSRLEGADKKVGTLLGNQISMFTKKKVKMGSYSRPQLTYREIYEILDAKPKLSDRLRLNMDKKAPLITGRKPSLKKGCVAVMLDLSGSYQKDITQITLEDVKKAGAALVISTQPVSFAPCIVVKNCKTAYMKLMIAIRDKYDVISVAITGTAGKTTTKELMSAVFDTHYNSLHIEGNYNQYSAVGMIIQKLSPEYQAYIQEVHGGTKNSAKNVSRMVKPNIAMITNVGEGHLKDMGTIENVVKGKMEITAGLQEGGTLIIDDDNPYLHAQHPDCNVVRCSLHNEICDYYARNIEDLGDRLKFQIVCKEGVYDAQLNFQGLHNIKNALGVFAAGRLAGIPPYKIIAGLSHYVPDDDKQHLTEVGGYKLIIDSYSSTDLSVISAIRGLASYPVEKGARRIAVLGDIPALGNQAEKVHKEVAREIVKYDFDLLICCGEDSVHFVEAAKAAGREAYYFEDRDAFNGKIIQSIRPGDVILFKGGTRLKFKEKTIYPIFGEIV